MSWKTSFGEDWTRNDSNLAMARANCMLWSDVYMPRHQCGTARDWDRLSMNCSACQEPGPPVIPAAATNTRRVVLELALTINSADTAAKASNHWFSTVEISESNAVKQFEINWISLDLTNLTREVRSISTYFFTASEHHTTSARETGWMSRTRNVRYSKACKMYLYFARFRVSDMSIFYRIYFIGR